MRTNASLIVLSLALCANFQAQAQTQVEIPKEAFFVQKEGFKPAWRNIKQGNREFDSGRHYYDDALDYYLAASQYNPHNPQLNYAIGVCYLASPNKFLAINYLELAYQADDSVARDILYQLGRAYQLTYQFDKATASYLAFKQFLQDELEGSRRQSRQAQGLFQARVAVLDKLMAECATATSLVARPERVLISNLGPNVNSPFPDYAAFFSPTANELLFTARRESTTGGRTNLLDDQYFEDIMAAQWLNEQWQPALGLDGKLNTKGNDAIVGMAPDGKTLFLARGRKRNGELFESRLDPASLQWEKPKPLRAVNSRRYQEISASMTEDGQTLYFISNDTKAGYGGFDIFMVEKNERGKWGKPTNLGPKVNTPYDEVSVFVSPDGLFLYFCSNGHNTMGGYDIFRLPTDVRGQWGTPENIGYPINTPDDESFFMMLDDRRAFYATYREDGLGDKDIYEIFYLGQEKPSYQSNEDDALAADLRQVSATPLPALLGTMVRGNVRSLGSGLPLANATVQVMNMANRLVINTLRTDAKGDFSAMVLADSLLLRADAQGHFFKIGKLKLPQAGAFQTVQADSLALQAIAIGAKVVLQNVFFDTGKAELRAESYPELDALARFLRDYPEVRIEISGHTDNTGNARANLTLSQNRADQVVKYLVNQGIPGTRFTAKGYADQQPISTNATPEGRQQNRRVEAKITQVD